jgi:hypothetical protein
MYILIPSEGGIYLDTILSQNKEKNLNITLRLVRDCTVIIY